MTLLSGTTVPLDDGIIQLMLGTLSVAAAMASLGADAAAADALGAAGHRRADP